MSREHLRTAMPLSAGLLLSLVLAVQPGCRQQDLPSEERELKETDQIQLFNGRDLDGWEVTDFGGQGEVQVRDGAIVLRWGNDLTGVTWAGEFPETNYELSLEARRLQGNDFFCALTFPVEEEFCSLLIGGWGGPVVGLTSINGRDASENETTRWMSFVTGQWYGVRLRVVPERIQAWIDSEMVVDVPTENRTFNVRPEVHLSRPLGLATWQTTGAIRHLRYRIIQPEH